MRLYLVRHPQPEIAPGICYGSTDLGIVDSAATRTLAALSTLAALGPDTPVYTSPLRRCSEFAALLAAAHGFAKIVCDARLAEMDFGCWEMRAWDDIPCEEIEAWAADPAGYRVGGGESVAQMAQRIHAFHAELKQCGHERAVVICHAGSIRLLLACKSGLTPAEMAVEAARAPHRIGYG